MNTKKNATKIHIDLRNERRSSYIRRGGCCIHTCDSKGLVRIALNISFGKLRRKFRK